MDKKQENIKTAVEIGTMAGQLNAANQSYVLNTINALLFSQQVKETAPVEPARESESGGQGKAKQE